MRFFCFFVFSRTCHSMVLHFIILIFCFQSPLCNNEKIKCKAWFIYTHANTLGDFNFILWDYVYPVATGEQCRTSLVVNHSPIPLQLYTLTYDRVNAIDPQTLTRSIRPFHSLFSFFFFLILLFYFIFFFFHWLFLVVFFCYSHGTVGAFTDLKCNEGALSPEWKRSKLDSNVGMCSVEWRFFFFFYLFFLFTSICTNVRTSLRELWIDAGRVCASI